MPSGYQRVYGTAERPIDVLAEVRTGDVVLVPHGWHGPAVAAPDADLYYLNVMAGPGAERAWLICDDPAHAWVRDTWPDLPVDPRAHRPDTDPDHPTHHDPKDTHMRIGLAGTGRIGAFHAKTLTTLDGRRRPRARRPRHRRSRNGWRPTSASAPRPSIDALLDSGLDAFVITAGTAAHAELLEAAIARDIPTFCEKPVALDLERTIALTELEATSERAGAHRLPAPVRHRLPAGARRGRVRRARLHPHGARRDDGPGAAARRLPADLRRPVPRLQRARLRHPPVRHRPARSAGSSPSAPTRASTFFTEAGDVDTAAATLVLDDGTLVS